MANYCYNHLILKETPARWLSFKDRIQGDGGILFDCEKVIPYPTMTEIREDLKVIPEYLECFCELRDLSNDEDARDLFELKHWGSDGRFYEGAFNDFNQDLWWYSAWAPPSGCIEKLLEEGWKLSFEYEEPGMCFIGGYSTRKGWWQKNGIGKLGKKMLKKWLSTTKLIKDKVPNVELD